MALKPTTSSRPPLPAARRERLPGEIVWLATAFFCLTIWVFLIRALSVIRTGQSFQTSGCEHIAVYGVWKAMKGFPLYTSPFNPPFNSTPYNYGFYARYAAALDVLGVGTSNLLNTARLLTVLFALLGAVAQWTLLRRILGVAARGRLLPLLCVACWFNSSLISWWSITVRPDIPALALVFCGLAFVFGTQPTERRANTLRWLAGGLAFCLAWSFKQSIALTLLAVAGCLAGRGETRRQAAWLFAGFASCVMFAWLAGGPDYRVNVSTALGVGEWSVKRGILIAARDVARNAYIFLPVLLFRASERRRHPVIPVLMVTTALGVLVATFGIMIPEAAGNYLFEPYFAAFTLVLLLLFDPALRPRKLVCCAILAAAISYPLAQIAAWALRAPTPWQLQLATDSELSDAVSLESKLASAPKPVLAPEIWSLPWFSTGGTFPAYVIDAAFIVAAEHAHLLAAGGLRGMIRRREFGSLLLTRDDRYFDEASKAGYIEAASFPGWGDTMFLYARPPRKGAQP